MYIETMDKIDSHYALWQGKGVWKKLPKGDSERPLETKGGDCRVGQHWKLNV